MWRCGRWNQGATGSIGFVSSVTCFSSMGSSGVTQSAKGTLELPHGITLTKRGGYRFSAASRIVCGGIQFSKVVHLWNQRNLFVFTGFQIRQASELSSKKWTQLPSQEASSIAIRIATRLWKERFGFS